MAYIVRMPKLGVEMQTGVVLEWVVEEGDPVEEGDVVAEIESEKTTAEVAARESGVLRRIVLEAGAEVEPGTAMGIVADPEEPIDDLLAEVSEELDGDIETGDADAGAGDTDAPAASGEAEYAAGTTEGAEPASVGPGDDGTDRPAAGSTRATPKARARAAEEGVDLASIRGSGPKGSVTAEDVERAASGDGVAGAAGSGSTASGSAAGTAPAAPANGSEPELVTPRARKQAAELDVDLATVEGTGPHGSIRADDVEAAAAAPSTAGAEPSAGTDRASTAGTAGADGRTVLEERRLTGTRATIARRLSESWEAPHVTVDRRVDVEAALEAAERAGDAVSITDVLLKAVSETLAEHPSFNATFEDGVHRVYEEHNVGFAVDTEAGLLTPVLDDVEDMSVVEIAHRRGALTDRVQGRRHDASDLQGGTFTVSNLGVLGIDSFTPIINPPQVAILGVTRIREDPRRTERGIEFVRTMGFSLSFDHRVVDGADAARFLGTLAEHLEAADELLEG